MTYDEISPTMRMFMGNFEGFRRIGFSADDLFLTVSRSVELDGAVACFCVLKTQGKEFSVLCGPIPNGDANAFSREYAAICEAMPSGIPQADMDRIWQESEIYEKSLEFIVALKAKGFRIPNMGN
jgi:hypothetical protein